MFFGDIGGATLAIRWRLDAPHIARRETALPASGVALGDRDHSPAAKVHKFIRNKSSRQTRTLSRSSARTKDVWYRGFFARNVISHSECWLGRARMRWRRIFSNVTAGESLRQRSFAWDSPQTAADVTATHCVWRLLKSQGRALLIGNNGTRLFVDTNCLPWLHTWILSGNK
jgi:hypothetical protein